MHFGGIAYVVLAAIFWGLSGGLNGFLMDKGWDPLTISFYRGFIGLIGVSIWYALKPSGWNKKLILWSLVAGIGVAGNFTFYAVSISEASIAVAATLMYTAPIFVLLISFIFNIEKATLFKWLAIGAVTAGIVLMSEVYDMGSEGVTLFGILTGLGAGLSYAMFLFGFKKAGEHGEPQSILITAFLTFSIILPFFMDFDEALSVMTSPDLLWMILLGVFGAGVSFFLYVEGLEKSSPTAASVSAMVEPVTASLFGVLVMSEVLTVIQMVGMGIILGTVTVLNMKKD